MIPDDRLESVERPPTSLNHTELSRTVPSGETRGVSRGAKMRSMPIRSPVSRALRASPMSGLASARLVVLLVVVALMTGIAATVVSASTLPTCRARGHAHQAALIRGLEPDRPRHHLPIDHWLLPRRPALDGERGPQ